MESRSGCVNGPSPAAHDAHNTALLLLHMRKPCFASTVLASGGSACCISVLQITRKGCDRCHIDEIPSNYRPLCVRCRPNARQPHLTTSHSCPHHSASVCSEHRLLAMQFATTTLLAAALLVGMPGATQRCSISTRLVVPQRSPGGVAVRARGPWRKDAHTAPPTGDGEN